MHHQELLLGRFKQECTDKELNWFNEMVSQGIREKKMGFVMTHRFVAQVPMESVMIRPHDLPYEVDLGKWTRDQLARTLILLSLDGGKQDEFQRVIEELFQTADNREAQAIYAGIPFFNYASTWIYRATEAIRSNVGLIFDAMAFNNPFPAIYFEDAAWNQLVLKTIFNDKSIWNIVGLKERRNQALAATISDFAHERWAAGRTLPPEVWYLTAPFPGDRFWQDVYRLLSSESQGNRQAGYLLWKAQSNEAPENFTETFKALFDDFSGQKIEWHTVDLSETS